MVSAKFLIRIERTFSSEELQPHGLGLEGESLVSVVRKDAFLLNLERFLLASSHTVYF